MQCGSAPAQVHGAVVSLKPNNKALPLPVVASRASGGKPIGIYCLVAGAGNCPNAGAGEVASWTETRASVYLGTAKSAASVYANIKPLKSSSAAFAEPMAKSTNVRAHVPFKNLFKTQLILSIDLVLFGGFAPTL